MTPRPMDYLTLRHRAPARWVRAGLARALGGAEAWPLTFRAPAPHAAPPAGTSGNLYVHLPFCEHLCPHCPYNRVLYKGAPVEAYEAALVRELQAYQARPQLPPVTSLYFGGGTPTRTPALIARVMALLATRLAPHAEVGVEVHPSDATPPLLAWLRDIGVTRISLGVETLDPALLHTLGRNYTPHEARAAVRAAKAAGFDCVDVNLIHGIPGQRAESAIEDACTLLADGVDQLSAYPLFGFAHTPLGQRGGIGPARDYERVAALRGISQACRAAGLVRTSVWSFTRPGVSPYSTVTHEDYVGFGAGAGSKVDGVFWFNTFSVPEYIACTEPRPALVLQVSEQLRRLHWLYWAVYATHVSARRYHERFGRAVQRDFALLLQLLTTLGLAIREGDDWHLTERGAIWVHRVQALFSLSYIDELWTRCRGEAWPREVSLA